MECVGNIMLYNVLYSIDIFEYKHIEYQLELKVKTYLRSDRLVDRVLCMLLDDLSDLS
jgi:hypothetical protein